MAGEKIDKKSERQTKKYATENTKKERYYALQMYTPFQRDLFSFLIHVVNLFLKLLLIANSSKKYLTAIHV